MSENPTWVTERHFDYVRERTRAEGEFLVELKRAARDAGIPQIWIAPEQASFIQILLRAAKARAVVEVGALAGYSAIQMARALPEGGRVTTIDVEPKHAAFARSWIARSDVAGKVEVVLGDAREVLGGLPADSFDAAFLDADKASYPAYLEHSLRLVRRGGLILVDNAFAFGQLFEQSPRDRDVAAVRAFNDQLARDPRVHGVIVPLGDGLWVATKL